MCYQDIWGAGGGKEEARRNHGKALKHQDRCRKVLATATSEGGGNVVTPLASDE